MFVIILPAYNSISCTDHPFPMSSGLLFSAIFLQGSVATVAAENIPTSNFWVTVGMPSSGDFQFADAVALSSKHCPAEEGSRMPEVVGLTHRDVNLVRSPLA